MSFTDTEKALVLKHLGFADWAAMAQSIQLGFPASSQPLFLVRDAFNRITPAGEAACREAICQCEDIYKQMKAARGRFAVGQVGEVKMRDNESALLRTEYAWWQGRLGDSFGVSPNAYSNLAMGGVGGINRSVIG